MVPRRGRQSILASVRVALVVLAVAFYSTNVPTQSASYRIIDLGTLGGSSAAGYDIEELGQAMAGQAQTSTGAYRAFVKAYGGLRDLGTLGGSRSMAFAIGGGFVVGQSQTESGQDHAFSSSVYRAEPLVDLGTLGGTWSAAYGVEYNRVVGASKTTGDARLQAFVHTNGLMSALALDWGGDSVARSVAGGLIVGYACTAGNASCLAFSFRDGVVTKLGSLGGNSVANAVSSSEQIAGTSVLADQKTTHAFRYANGTLTDLGTLGGGASSEGLGVNARGDVVGTSDTASSGRHAFLWQNGVMTDLNALLPAGSGWILESASAISDGGQIVGTGTLNGVTRGFFLTPPFRLSLHPFGVGSLQDSNLPRGAEVGRKISFVFSALVNTEEGVTMFGTRVTDTLTGPAEYVSAWSDNATCQVTPKVVTCDLAPINSAGLGIEIFTQIQTTGAGGISHTAAAFSDPEHSSQPDATVSEENWAAALSALTLTPSTLAGGKASSSRVTLTDIAPFSKDATVRLTSSRPDVAPVPATIVVPYPTTWRAFNIIPKVVSEPTPVEISATYGQVTIKQTLTVVPPALSQLSLTPTTIIGGCATSAGKITLSGSAPAGGAVVTLSNTNAKATVPASITVPAGASAAKFTVTTSTVTAPSSGSATASYGGVSKTLAVTVRPIRSKTLTLSPNPATGGTTVSASVTLECAAPAGGIVVSLSSGNAAVAAPTATSVTIPAGATTGSFSVRTTRPAAQTAVSIYATVYGVRKSATLTVN